jgi:hypothetical protein
LPKRKPYTNEAARMFYNSNIFDECDSNNNLEREKIRSLSPKSPKIITAGAVANNLYNSKVVQH